MIERTFALIKPDAVARGYTGPILYLTELNGFKVIRMEKLQLTKNQAEEFYDVHKGKPFFDELVTSVTAGPVIAMALEAENGISAWRELMGATDPSKATLGTLRKMFASSMTHNATHGSDAPETAKIEIAFFFNDL